MSDLFHDQIPRQESPIQEYEYVVEVRALETFINVMNRQGVRVTLSGQQATFTSEERFNMKRLQEMGLIRSYAIIRVRKGTEVIERQ